MNFYAIRKNWEPTLEMKLAVAWEHLVQVSKIDCTKCNEAEYELWISPLDNEKHIVDSHEKFLRDTLLRHCPDHLAIIDNRPSTSLAGKSR
jgi:hypothetical protein